MKRASLKSMVVGAALTGALLATTANATLVFDYSNVGGAAVNFTGGSVGVDGERYFKFTPEDNQFKITGTQGGSGSASGLTGNFGTTRYHVGTIDAYDTADILDTGTLTIHDGASFNLTATVDWKNIGTLGQGGFLNANGVINLSTIVYGGSNSDLLAFKSGTDQRVTLIFGFSSLTEPLLKNLMESGAQNATSFAGSMSAVPEASTWVAGSGMLGMLLLFGTGAHGRVRRVFRLEAKKD
jgi:hypothetical protein